MRSSKIIYSPDRHKLPMIIRARYAWTFFGLGLFASANLLLGGLYLLNEAIRDPLAASGMAIITSGFLLTLSAFLLTYLVWPRAKSCFETRAHPLDPGRDAFRCRVLTIPARTIHAPLDAIRAPLQPRLAPPLRTTRFTRVHGTASSVPPVASDDVSRVRQ